MRVVEIILYVIFLFGYSFKVMHYPGASVMIILSLMNLALLYMVFGFLVFNSLRFRQLFKKDTFKGMPPIKIIGAVCFGIAMCSLLVGVTFSIQHYPGAKVQLLVGFSTTILGLAIYGARALSGYSTFFKRNWLRLIIPVGFGAFFMFVSQGDYQVMLHGGRNEVEDEIIRNHYNNPQDIDAKFEYDSLCSINNPYARPLESLRQERDIRKAMETNY